MRILPFISIIFFALQVYFIIWGKDVYSQFVNPLLLFLAFLGLAICYFINIFQTDFIALSQQANSKVFKYVAITLSLIFFSFCFQEVRSLFSRYLIPDVGNYTDVLPLIIKQYEFFLQGKTPYQLISLPSHSAYPAYMPLHWLPIGISDIFGKDPRWGGLLLLVVVSLLFVFSTACKQHNWFFNLICIVLPASIIYVFIRWAGFDIAITFETVIAAYYFFLAIALMQRNIAMIVIGIVLCLLSRYTLVFWLPLFFVLLYFNLGFRKTAISIVIILLMFCLFFVFPFLISNPSIIFESLAYHNNAAIADWSNDKYSFLWGVYFGANIDFFIDGSAEHKVFIARMIQASTMLLLFVGGLFLYWKNKHRANFYDISLGMLYATIVGFYMLGPLAFRYYMLSTLYISAVLLARILMAKKRIIPKL